MWLRDIMHIRNGRGTMKNKLVILHLIVSFLICGIALNSCARREPPSEDEIYARFQESREDISIVVDYFLTSDYEHIIIYDADEPVFADFANIELDETVKNAARSLLKKHGFIAIVKDTEYNALEFLMWTGAEISCGVLYAINRDKLPETEIPALLISLPDDGWYYYVADYNEWRANNS